MKTVKLYVPKTGEDYVGTMVEADKNYSRKQYVSLKDYEKLNKEREELLKECSNYIRAINELFDLIANHNIITSGVYDDAIEIYNNAEIKERLK